MMLLRGSATITNLEDAPLSDLVLLLLNPPVSWMMTFFFFHLKVHETPSEESVTLMGRDIEIRIAFKGQAKALKQFRNMLVPSGANTASGEHTQRKR